MMLIFLQQHRRNRKCNFKWRRRRIYIVVSAGLYLSLPLLMKLVKLILIFFQENTYIPIQKVHLYHINAFSHINTLLKDLFIIYHKIHLLNIHILIHHLLVLILLLIFHLIHNLLILFHNILVLIHNFQILHYISAILNYY